MAGLLIPKIATSPPIYCCRLVSLSPMLVLFHVDVPCLRNCRSWWLVSWYTTVHFSFLNFPIGGALLGGWYSQITHQASRGCELLEESKSSFRHTWRSVVLRTGGVGRAFVEVNLSPEQVRPWWRIREAIEQGDGERLSLQVVCNVSFSGYYVLGICDDSQ